MRRPELRNRILLLFLQKGKLSVSMAEQYLSKHHHPEITQSFRRLQSMGHIRKIPRNPGKGIPFAWGRPREYYEITEAGLRYLIEDDIRPERLWYLLIAYCHNYTDAKDISLASIRTFYSLFLSHYLRYTAVANIACQLDYVNQMIERWLNRDTNKRKKDIKIDQKILETLALLPNASLDDLSIITNASTNIMQSTLAKYLMINPKNDFENFLQQCVIIGKQDESKKEHYELSLYGIILIMTLIRRSQAGNNKLFYNNLSIEEYYSSLAKNYSNKLPLILGKWSQVVKRNLMSWAEYNFDIILADEGERLKIMNTPVTMGGNKDLHENIRSLTLYNYKKIVEVLDIGLSMLRKYNQNKLDNNLSTESENSTKGSQTAKLIHGILKEIQASLAYLNPEDFIRDFYRQERKRKEYVGRQSATLLGLRTAYDSLIADFDLSSGDKSVVDNLEKSLSNEITFLYYINLINPIFSPLNEGYLSVHKEIMSQLIEMSSRSSYMELEQHGGIKIIYSPKKRLISILKQDSEIRKWFFSIMDDIIRYQNETSRSISHIYNEANQMDAGVQV